MKKIIQLPYVKECLACGKHFEVTTRHEKKFCTQACRTMYSRYKSEINTETEEKQIKTKKQPSIKTETKTKKEGTLKTFFCETKEALLNRFKSLGGKKKDVPRLSINNKPTTLKTPQGIVTLERVQRSKYKITVDTRVI